MYFTNAEDLKDPKQLKIILTKSIDDAMHFYFKKGQQFGQISVSGKHTHMSPVF